MIEWAKRIMCVWMIMLFGLTTLAQMHHHHHHTADGEVHACLSYAHHHSHGHCHHHDATHHDCEGDHHDCNHSHHSDCDCPLHLSSITTDNVNINLEIATNELFDCNLFQGIDLIPAISEIVTPTPRYIHEEFWDPLSVVDRCPHGMRGSPKLIFFS